jgi:transaldolase
MAENPLRKLESFGQSVWLDLISRGLIKSGGLRKLIEEDGLSGVTSNPAIFEKAIDGSRDYDEDLRRFSLNGTGAIDICERLMMDDIRAAADELRPIYDRLDGADGFVGMEVSPHLAHDTQGTIEEARRLWRSVRRPNIFIKVPATREGLPAIRQLISEGINVNITLLFGLPRYREVAEAYIAGLEACAAADEPVNGVASVASFFLSRIDVLVDPMLEHIVQAGGDKATVAENLIGEIAIASAKEAYQIYREMFASDRFRPLAERGARTQRVLWASTSTKNPKYSDVKYVEPLIGPDTINTMPPETIDAYRNHGRPGPRIEENADVARRNLKELADVGIDIDAITQQLEDEGVEKFIKPWDQLMATVKSRRDAIVNDHPKAVAAT